MALVRRFLLGDLPESERAQIEDRLLEHDDFYQELLIAEDELIDAYVREELPAVERALFERRRLILPHLRERVDFAQALLGSASPVVLRTHRSTSASSWGSLWRAFFPRRPALGIAFAAALLLTVLAGLWFLTDKLRTRPAPEQTQIIQPNPATPRETSTPEATAQQQQPALDDANQLIANRKPTPETPKRTAAVIATFTLAPGLVRSGKATAGLTLPAAATDVRLRLTLDGESYEKYRATLSTPEGSRVWSGEVGNPSSRKSSVITLNLPANLFRNGDYVLDLSGANASGKWESVADYSFRIVKK